MENGPRPSERLRITETYTSRNFKSNPGVIRLAVMLYIGFPRSLRNVEDLLHESGINVSRETIRHWWSSSGPMFAADIRNRRIAGVKPGKKRWHPDEMSGKTEGARH